MHKIGKMQVLAALVAAWTVASAQAQVTVPPSGDAGALRQRQIEEEARRRDEERLRQPITEPLRRDGLPSAPVAPAAGQDQGPRFQVNTIEFGRSAILGTPELEAIARDYQGRMVTFGELQQLVARVNALYRARNVVTAQAVISPQDVSQGVVRVRLVEGRIGQLVLRGNASTQTEFITNRIGLKPGDLVDLDRLEPSLIRFNRSNDVQLRAELKPGATFGLTDLLVDAVEPARQDFRLTVDNLGSESTGAWRVGAAYVNRSLLGLRDELSLSTTSADGLNGLSLGYGFSVNRWGGRLNLGVTRDRTAIVHGTLAPLNITGASDGRTLSLRQPVYVVQQAQLDLLAGVRRRISSNWIDSVFLQRTQTKDHNLGVEAQYFAGDARWLGNYTRYFGEVRVFAPTSLQIDRGNVRVDKDLGGGYAVRGSLGWQRSEQRNLPSSEQYSIGGDGSVRGYAPSVLSGDVGHTLNLEWHHPIGRAAIGTGEIAATGFVFFDRGDVTPLRPPNSALPAREHLSSIGWGVNAAINKNISARIVIGYGLNKLAFDSSRYRIHFQLVASLL